jgi:5-formyltetrahydrofolate cyclo-ligase
MTIPTAMAAPHTISDTTLDEAKRAARAAALAARAGCDPARGAALVDIVAPVVPPGAVVAGFWPLPGEIDVRPLLAALHEAGHRLCLPQTPARGRPLSFHRWQPGDRLHAGRFGTHAPDSLPVEPTLLLVPLLAFDRRGRRLGYGAGYYDRTLSALPGVRSIGCAFAAQEIPAVPAGPHDVPLGAIATECCLIPIRT